MADPISVPDLLRDILADASRRQKLWDVLRSVHRRAPYLIEAEELYQTVILRALTAAAQFRGGTDAEFLSWLRTIAHNCLMDALRECARRPQRVSLEEQLVPGVEQSPQTVAANKDQVARVLAALTPLEAALLNAKFEGGLSAAQIAHIIEQSPAAVRQTHHRLIARLRERFGADTE